MKTRQDRHAQRAANRKKQREKEAKRLAKRLANTPTITIGESNGHVFAAKPGGSKWHRRAVANGKADDFGKKRSVNTTGGVQKPIRKPLSPKMMGILAVIGGTLGGRRKRF